MKDAVNNAYQKFYSLGAMFTLGALWFTMATSETVYDFWDIFWVTVVGAVGWPLVWGATVANVLDTYVGG